METDQEGLAPPGVPPQKSEPGWEILIHDSWKHSFGIQSEIDSLKKAFEDSNRVPTLQEKRGVEGDIDTRMKAIGRSVPLRIRQGPKEGVH